MVLNICNLLRAVESLKSSLHFPIIAWARKKDSKKGTGHCFHNADTIDDLNGWLMCYWCWSWRYIGKHGRGCKVLFNILCSSWPRSFVASQHFNLPLHMIEKLNMSRQSCYSISPIFHWIGLSTRQTDRQTFSHRLILLMQSLKHVVIVPDLMISMSRALSRFKILAFLI